MHHVRHWYALVRLQRAVHACGQVFGQHVAVGNGADIGGQVVQGGQSLPVDTDSQARQGGHDDVLGVGQGVKGGHLARHHHDEQAAHLLKKTVQGRAIAPPITGERWGKPATAGLGHGHGPRSAVVHGLPSQGGRMGFAHGTWHPASD